MNILRNSENSQIDLQEDLDTINNRESVVDLSSQSSASPKTWVSNPFDQLYQIEDCIYDNAPPEIKEIIGDLTESHFDYYTVDNLEAITQQIKHNQLAYVKDAIAYYNIMTTKLYKAKYSNFNKYCQTELGMTSWRAKQVIEAGAVTLKLIAAGHSKVPLNCSQAYAMSKLNDDTLLEVWESVLSVHHIHELTAEKIKLVAFPPEPTDLLSKSNINVSASVYEFLVVNACELKMTINDYIKYFIDLQKCKLFLLFSSINFKT